MTHLSSLWLPIVVSAVAVFVLSFLIHMILPWHKSDYPSLPDEDRTLDALRPLAIPPGEYMFPRPRTRKDMGSPEFAAKRARGPVGILTMIPPGSVSMGPYLIRWFIYVLVVSGLSSCLAAVAFGPGAPDHSIFHFTAFAALLCYAVGLWPQTIWYHRPVSTTLKATFDALIYAVATGLVFTYMWPKA